MEEWDWLSGVAGGNGIKSPNEPHEPVLGRVAGRWALGAGMGALVTDDGGLAGISVIAAAWAEWRQVNRAWLGGKETKLPVSGQAGLQRKSGRINVSTGIARACRIAYSVLLQEVSRCGRWTGQRSKYWSAAPPGPAATRGARPATRTKCPRARFV